MTMSTTDASRHDSAGFTLLEVLVALTLMAVVSLTALNALGIASRGLDRLSQRAERADEHRILATLMQHSLTAAVAVPSSDGLPSLVGGPTSIAFLSVVDDGGPGLYRIRLALVRAQIGQELVFSRRVADDRALSHVQESVLMHNVHQLAISYFGADALDAEASWHSRWEALTYFPELIRIKVVTDDGADHPAIIVRLRDGDRSG